MLLSDDGAWRLLYMVGRRVYGRSPYLFEPGDYGRWAEDDFGWYARTPNGHVANLGRHDVVELADWTITVAPSIAVNTSRPDGKGGMVKVRVYHGYLDQGVWRDA